jgi:hypothetical protein
MSNPGPVSGVMGIARVLGVSPVPGALAIHTANAEDFEAAARQADVIEQTLYAAAADGRSPSAMYALGVMNDAESAETEVSSPPCRVPRHCKEEI